jgi:hypothetical protein
MRAVMAGSPHLQQVKTKKKSTHVYRIVFSLPLPLFIVYLTFERDGDEDKVGDTCAYCFIYLAVRSEPHV